MVCTGPIFRRMIVVPLENTITCGESMGTPDDEHDNFPIYMYTHFANKLIIKFFLIPDLKSFFLSRLDQSSSEV